MTCGAAGRNRRWPPGRLGALLGHLGLALILAAALPRSAGADEWVQVASGGLGRQDHPQVDALEIHGGAIFAATHDRSSPVVPALYRADLRRDDLWLDVTPGRWSGATGEVTDLLSWKEGLYVGTSSGQIWRLGADGRWAEIGPPWAEGRAIFGLTAWQPPGQDAERLTASCEGTRVGYLRDDGLWLLVETPREFHTTRFASGSLASWEGRLYAGVGGAAAGGTTAQVWFLGSRAIGPYAVTRTGFDRPELTWVYEMLPFAGRLYIGTGGHDGAAGIFRTPGVFPEDATPCDVFTCGSPYFPVRFRLAVAAGRLYAGTNRPTIDAGGGNVADVVASGDGDAWAFSAPPSFGAPANEAISALEGSRPYLYAGTVNYLDGFEIWRRTPLLTEMLPYVGGELDLLLRRTTKILGCVRGPGCRGWRRRLRPIDEIQGLFETARHPQDDPGIIAFARAQLNEAQALLGAAVRKVRRASKVSRSRRSLLLRRQAAALVQDAIEITREACRKSGLPLPE